MKSIHITGVVLAIALAWGMAGSRAAAGTGAPDIKPLALRGIMQDMEARMRDIAQAIHGEDWPRAEDRARRIATHPQPPFTEKIRILGFVGVKVGGYKAHDSAMRDAAEALAQASGNRDGESAKTAFLALRANCDNCHREFRAPFVAHFYGER